MTKIRDWIKRILRRIPRLPRKWRVVRNLACTLLLAAVFIVPQFDLYPRTLARAFQRECQANLLGDPEIIWQDGVGADGQKVFLVADDGDRYFYGVFQDYGLRGWNGSLIPWEKESGLTFMPFEIFCDPGRDIALKLLLLHDVEGASYAQVDIPLEAYDQFSETYTVGLSATVKGIMLGCCFRRSLFRLTRG